MYLQSVNFMVCELKLIKKDDDGFIRLVPNCLHPLSHCLPGYGWNDFIFFLWNQLDIFQSKDLVLLIAFASFFEYTSILYRVIL